MSNQIPTPALRTGRATGPADGNGKSGVMTTTGPTAISSPDHERRLTFRFLTLPFRHQIAIANCLDVLADEDRALSDEALFRELIKRAAANGLLGKLWEETEKRHADPAPFSAPELGGELNVTSATRIAFGVRVLDRLGFLECNQAWLEANSGVSRSVISRLLRGLRRPTREHAVRIAAALGMTLPELLGGTDAEALLGDEPLSASRVADLIAEVPRLRSRLEVAERLLASEQSARRGDVEALEEQLRLMSRRAREAERQLERSGLEVAVLREQLETCRGCGRAGAEPTSGART